MSDLRLDDFWQALDELVGPLHPASYIVVSDLPANRNVFSANVHGLVTPTGDAVALSSAIVRLLRDAALAQRLGQAAREHACRSFPLDKMVNQHLQLFDLLDAEGMRFRLAGATFRWRCTVCRLAMTSEAAAVAHVLATRHLVAGSMTSLEHIGDPFESDRLQHREGWL